MAITAEFGIQPFQTEEEARAYRENMPIAMRSTARGPIQGLASLSGMGDIPALGERLLFGGGPKFWAPESEYKSYGESRQDYLENIGGALVPGKTVEGGVQGGQLLTELAGIGIVGKQAIDLIRKYGPQAIVKIKSIFIKNPETTVDDAVQIALSERTGYMPSTSGYASPKTKMYHGAKGELPEEFMGFEDYASSTGSVYGGGFYTTSRTGTAKGYAGKKGNLYEITPKKELKLFDMEQSVPPSIKQSIKRGGDYKIKSRGETFEMTDEFLLRTQDFLDDNPKASLVELYDEMRALAPYEGITPGDLEEYFHGFAFILQKAGYKGLRHKGGVLSSRPKKHEVNIYWNPGKDLNIKPVAKADLAAGEKTVERATTGEKAKITRHSRGGLVENKVNYALNQWN